MFLAVLSAAVIDSFMTSLKTQEDMRCVVRVVGLNTFPQPHDDEWCRYVKAIRTYLHHIHAL